MKSRKYNQETRNLRIPVLTITRLCNLTQEQESYKRWTGKYNKEANQLAETGRRQENQKHVMLCSWLSGKWEIFDFPVEKKSFFSHNSYSESWSWLRETCVKHKKQQCGLRFQSSISSFCLYFKSLKLGDAFITELFIRFLQDFFYYY